MRTTDRLTLSSSSVAALPIINHFLDRLQVAQLLSKHLPPPDPRTQAHPAEALGILLRSLILSRSPLYSVPEWASQMLPHLLADTPLKLSDDRIGRALDRLFDLDRSALLTELVLTLIAEFHIGLKQFHTDATTITLSGQYREADGRPVRGRGTVKAAFGHSKDHRFDLKQLLWFLTVSEDGAVPVHFKVADGNTAESLTHIDNWRTLRQLVGSADFLYIADCKLCSRRSLSYIHTQGGRFITVLPRTRKEDARFRHWITGHSPAWQEIARYAHHRSTGGPADVVQAMDSPLPDSDGYRLIWYHSSYKQDQDAKWRQQQLERAVSDLEQLKVKVERSRSRYTARAGIAQKVEQILAYRGAQRWLRYRIEERQERRFRQEHRGRPGEQTRWRSSVKLRFVLSWEPSSNGIEEDARQDGIFPLLTNCRELSMREVLEAYRCKQPLIEKRHELLKTVLEVRPVFLKSISRIEAFLFLEFVAVIVHAVIEREIRRAMKRARITKLPLYPEERECAAPTAGRIFELFANLQRHRLKDGSRIVKTFLPNLSPVQKRVLDLLGIPAARFRQERD